MSDLQDIALAKLEPHPHNVRRELHDLDDLAASIRAKGIVQALTVVPHPTARTKYMVLGGHRRLAAAKLAKVKTAPCMIREDLTTAESQTEFMVVENTQRNDLTPMEEARAYQQLLELPGYNAKLIAENTGRKTRLVSERIKLSKVSDPIAAKLDGGQITLEQALIFAEFADDDEATSKLLKATGTYDWEYQVRRFRQEKKAAAQAMRTEKELAAVGTTVIARPEGYPWSGEYAPYLGDVITPAEHVAAGHKPMLDNDGGATWAVLRSELPDEAPAARELTPEEIAEAEEFERIEAGLAVAAQVRHQFLEDLLSTSPDGLAWKLALDKATDYFNIRKGTRSLIGLTEDAKPADVEAALAKFTLEQLVLAQQMGHLVDASDLLHPDGWGESRWGSDYMKSQRTQLNEVYGYQWSDLEKEAMERARRRREERLAAEAARKAAADAVDEDLAGGGDHD